MQSDRNTTRQAAVKMLLAIFSFGLTSMSDVHADCRMAVSSNAAAPTMRIGISSVAGRLSKNVAVSDGVDALAVSTGANSKLYWAEHVGHSIIQANLDGSAPQLLVSAPETPLSMAVHDGFLYWTSSLASRGVFDGSVYRVSLSGGAFEQVVSDTAPPYGLSFGPDGRMYWVSTAFDQSISLSRGSVWSARADGTDLQQVADLTALAQQSGYGNGNSLPYGLAIDPESGDLYVAENFTGVQFVDRVIWRLDNSGKNGVALARFPGALTVPGPSLLFELAFDSDTHALFADYYTLFSPEGSGIYRLPTETDNLPYSYDAASNDPRDLHRYRVGIWAEHLVLIGPEQGQCASTKTLSGSSRSDYMVWRPKLGQWFVLPSESQLNGAFYTRQWGLSNDVPLVGNFDGDAALDMTVWRRHEGMWYICDWNLSGACAATSTTQWGLSGDYPMIADFNGDGLSDLTVWRPSNGSWYYRVAEGAEARIRQWGLPGDIPLAGDFNRDGRDDFVVYRPSFGLWYVLYSSFEGQEPGEDATMVRQWGLPGDVPLTGDYDGDTRPDLVVWRPPTGMWYLCLSSTEYQCQSRGVAKQFGLFNDSPIRGDFDGDGINDLAVWRPSSGNWYSFGSSSKQFIVRQWGLNGDVPLMGGSMH